MTNSFRSTAPPPDAVYLFCSWWSLGTSATFLMKFSGSSAMASDSQYEFGSYRLDAQSGMLFREGEGERVALSPKVAELLVALVQAEGSVLTREQLLQQVWPDTVIEEGSLSSHI